MLQHPQKSPENAVSRPVSATMGPSQYSRQSRANDPMSLANIMTSTDSEPIFKHASTTHSHSESKHSTGSSHHQSHPHSTAKTMSKRPETVKPQAVSTPSFKGSRLHPIKAEIDREVANIDQAQQSILDNDDDDEDDEDVAYAKAEYLELCRKRTIDIEQSEESRRKRRRLAIVDRYHDPLNNYSNYTKARYFKAYKRQAWYDVQAQEVVEEKERKKDMQRKRRREKTLANEWQKRDEAYEKAQNAQDEEEKARLLREVEKHEKKLRSATRLLNGQSPTSDGVPNSAVNGSSAGTFHVVSDDAVPSTANSVDSKRGGRSRSGKYTRPRKSKAQKQAEKDAAAAAQAAVDRGEDIPPPAPKTPRTPAVDRKGSAQSVATASPSGRKKPGPKPKALREALAAAAAAAAAAGEEPPDMSIVESQAVAALQEAAERKKEAKEAREALKAAKIKEKETDTSSKQQPYSSKAYNALYDHIWRDISRRDVPKVYRIKENSAVIRASNLRKTAQLAGKEARRWQVRTNKSSKDVQARAKRSMREMLGFWKRNERDERDQRKMAEKMELENAKRIESEREASRQRRKLNFLISQTELYSHFIGKKVRTEELEQSSGPDATAPAAEAAPAKTPVVMNGTAGSKVTDFDQLDFDNEDESALQSAAMANAQNAVSEAQERARQFNQTDQNDPDDDGEMNFQNPTSLQTMDVSQPTLLSCQLKEYQLKGLNWLVNLYEQGINGILADEMGLGKTVQSISVMAYLAEVHNIWGPFLVVAPASTLHNWQQEIAKFMPDFKALPYWGTAKDRKVLRKYWDRKHITYTKDSPFHVLITSYQMVVQDTQYFQKMRWQYMILDEAQAIKSSQSSRWKALLTFHCRNRLLLTGTPIQNNMQELWALLHFIMPTLFDSHDEFSDWFSKDIESHAQSNTKLNEDQLKRLHMILKPFMLRRIKKHVQKELGDKVELDVYCSLTYRQRNYYASLRNKISIIDILERVSSGSEQDSATLMNLVMQFRKVCNHPDLFERSTTVSPLSLASFSETASFLREGNLVNVDYSTRSLIKLPLPRLVHLGGGQLNVASSSNNQAGWRARNLGQLMNIWTEDHVADNSQPGGSFSFLRFSHASPAEACRAARLDPVSRAIALKRDEASLLRLSRVRSVYNDEDSDDALPQHSMFMIVNSDSKRANSEVCVTSRMHRLFNIHDSVFDKSGLAEIEACARPIVWAPPAHVDVSSHHAMQRQTDMFFDSSIRSAISLIPAETEQQLLKADVESALMPVSNLVPRPNNIRDGFTYIQVPSMQRFVSDSGKLACLDRLLKQLKANDHRVLLYFQMTRMIDMVEEYLTYRGYKYCRLDGSTKMEDRRDTVADFQSNPEIFIFLLSTRAGGLGINLTSADTVIFYDSDWNPTIDSQAMDRAHRLGQTKQVTVYRLITRNTIEERIRKRAMQKEEVQRVVITGRAGAGVDFNGRNRENRAKDMALWLADDDEAELIEQRERERETQEAAERTNPTPASRKKKTGPAKQARPVSTPSLEDMYHEGEGHFDDNSNWPSNSGTPGEDTPPAQQPAATTASGRGGRRKPSGPTSGAGASGGTTRRARAIKQRLAIADGGV